MDGSKSLAAIEAAGIFVDHAVDMGLSQAAIVVPLTAATGRVLAGVGRAGFRPTHVMLVLGDRYEILGAVCAALISRALPSYRGR